MGKYSINPLIEKVIKLKFKETGDLPTHKQIVKYLEKNHPDAVEKYLKSHRESLLSGAVTRNLALQRNQLRRTSLAERLMSGTASQVFDLEDFWATPFHVPGFEWKTLGELTGADHDAIADKYELGAVALASRAELHRNLAEKVGNSTTREVFDPKALMRQIDAAYDTQHQLGG